MTRLFNGKTEVPIKTETERLLLIAIKTLLCVHGQSGALKTTISELACHRFAFTDATRWRGDVQILTDGNNGRDVVRLIEEVKQ